MSGLITRRGLLAGSAAAASTLLTGCDRLADAPSFRWLLDLGQSASLRARGSSHFPASRWCAKY
jgi:hypothetical protein